MIVQRSTMRVKPGRMKEWVEVIKVNHGKSSKPDNFRLYTSHADPALHVQDLEFESVAEKDEWWEEWKKTPEHDAIVAAYPACVEEYLGSEIWTLE